LLRIRCLASVAGRLCGLRCFGFLAGDQDADAEEDHHQSRGCRNSRFHECLHLAEWHAYDSAHMKRTRALFHRGLHTNPSQGQRCVEKYFQTDTLTEAGPFFLEQEILGGRRDLCNSGNWNALVVCGWRDPEFPRSLVLGSLPPTIAGIPPERRPIHQQSAQEVSIWAARGWRALRPVRQSVVLRKVTVESSACVARRQGSIRWTIPRRTA